MEVSQNRKERIIGIVAILLSVWFAITSGLWVYYMNLVISFPIGILAFLLWKYSKKKYGSTLLNKIAGIILLIGMTISLISLLLLL